ncbi:putative RNA recognition motif containing protein [Lyophyllum shimeji]|uniref:RNA recognition motif containing protein n=1 Tax=Lyophyllum shimeji TaxID=47721 RepID=A0A9P3US75_LYOSH|nr:putative RNA recognition motif containing protein [Lyophyllum shimeji]
MDSEYDHAPQDHESHGPHPHPYLHEPLLYISNIPPFVTDENLAMAFVSCGPFRPKIPRDASNNIMSGTIEFRFIEKAEKALATLQSRPIPALHPPVPLVLSPYPPTNPPTPLPPPSALPRLVKHLPPGYTDSQLYDLFRPFGALASVRTQTHFGPDTGTIEFWNEDDARAAEEAMHCADVEGQNIAVQVYQARRTSGAVNEFSANAPTFVPSGSMFSAYPAQYSPPLPQRGSPYSVRQPQQPPVSPFVHGPGQQVQLAPVSGPGSTSHSGLIDPCNLFCKNLDPEIDSNGLFSHFRQFGQIVSARVMRNENGESRGFGFVSFQTPAQASAAMHAMNGVQLGSKQVVVRLHEPKQLRQEKLAQRFGHNGHPRSASGATSPAASEAGDSYGGWSSPRRASAPLSPVSGQFDRPEKARRGSGSYFNAALSGNLNLPMRYDDLAALSPVVRKEVLTGELSRRVKTLEIVPNSDVNSIVESLVGLSLSEVVQCIEDPMKLEHHVNGFKHTLKTTAPSKSPSPAASQDSRLLDPNAPATASAPEHPSTPISVSPALSSPPRTSSPSGSVPPTSERDRVFAAVSKLESSRQTELTDLLMSLPKRERAMCLFNVEVLRAKLLDAKMVLDSDDGTEDQKLSDAQSTKSAPQAQAAPVTPQTKKHVSRVEESPKTPDLSSRGPSAASSPQPGTPGGPTTTHTIASLAKLPASEIIRIARSSSATGLPLPKADALVVQATDEFIDGLRDKPSQVQKQQLGEKLFKVVKSFGIKGAPKVTVALLDQEDLRSLAHLMNSYPAVLKEKALAVTSSK